MGLRKAGGMARIGRLAGMVLVGAVGVAGANTETVLNNFTAAKGAMPDSGLGADRGRTLWHYLIRGRWERRSSVQG